MLEAFRAWLHRWQEPVVWLPLLFLALVAAYYVLPALDPRAGIDGFGSLFGLGLAAFEAIVAGFLAWLMVESYHHNPRDRDERELIDHAAGIVRSPDPNKPPLGHGPQSWPAVVLFVWPQLLWLAIFFGLLAYFRG